MDQAAKAEHQWRLDASLLETLPTAVLRVDLAGDVVGVNEGATTLLGRSREALLGLSFAEGLFVPDDAGGAGEVLHQVIGLPRMWHGELRAYTPDGDVTVRLDCTPAWEQGEVSGAVVLLTRPGALSDSERPTSSAGQLARLGRVTAELMRADNLEAVVKVVVEHAADAAGATVSSLSLLVDDHTLALIGLRGGVEGSASKWATYPLSSHTPSSLCVRTGEPVLLQGSEEIHEHFPDLDSAAEGERTLVALPLRSTKEAIGSYTLSFPGHRRLAGPELEFLGILADTCAQAIERVNAVADSVDQRTKLRFLADASAELAGDLDYQRTLTRVAELAVPDFADWCAIQLAEDGDLRTIAIAHPDPAKVALARDLQERYPPDRDAPSGAYEVLRSGRSELIPEIPDEMLVQATVDVEHLRLARELNLRSALSVPLIARERTLGVITWVAGEHGRRFSASDLSFGEDLARRAAIAIDNSQLHSETREASVRLQRAVLPTGLPQVDGWRLGSLYLPAGRTDVGGDFYDVIRLDQHRLVLFVGDVMGRGVTAAAAMAQLRAAVRAFLAIDPNPTSVLDKLDVMFERFELAQLVTLVYAALDTATGEATLVNAGHPPPVVVRADGTVDQLPDPDGVPLGVEAEARRASHVTIGPADTLLAFSDGLIERRGEDIDVGQQRLRDELAARGPATDLTREAELEVLVQAVRDHTRDDDVAVLALHRLDPS